MKRLLIFIIINLTIFGNAQSKNPDHVNQLTSGPFFQGTKWFCCDYRKGKYKLTIKGSTISITLSYNEKESTIKGVIKNGKIYTNDPLEKRTKNFSGNVYILKNERFHILTGEGGEYDEYYECKQ